MEQWSARQAHNLEVGGSNPSPATLEKPMCLNMGFSIINLTYNTVSAAS
jgi:hypothetical protein